MYEGKYVLVRGESSGIFAGTLKAKDGREVELTECRRIWYWEGAASISQMAIVGTKKPQECKFPAPVASIVITDVIEIIPCTAKAEASIKAVKEWKM